MATHEACSCGALVIVGMEEHHRCTANLKPIYTCSYPKSGVTWLTRLLGDALDSPTGGSLPAEDKKEVATEGQERSGPYVVRKGHYRLFGETAPVAVPRPHCMHWRALGDSKVVFITRDPRDVCVSGAYYWNTKPGIFLMRMVKGDVAHLPPWNRYVRQWLDAPFGVVHTSYEALLEQGAAELSRLVLEISPNTKKGSLANCERAIKAQSFEARKDDYSGPHPDQHQRIMRKGQVGDWRNYFNPAMGQLCHEQFGELMLELGYIDSEEWWSELAN